MLVQALYHILGKTVGRIVSGTILPVVYHTTWGVGEGIACVATIRGDERGAWAHSEPDFRAYRFVGFRTQ